jgi:hypothetical protein
MGIYILPNNTVGGEDLWATWEACLANCSLIIMGNLNIYVEHPRHKWKAAIANLLDEINLVDTSHKFTPWRCSLQRCRLCWTWCQKHWGRWIYSQPDYIIACEGDIQKFLKVGFQSPPIHNTDHRTVVVHIRKGRHGSLKTYWKGHQQLPITLPPGEQDKITCQFEELKASIVHPNVKRPQKEIQLINVL